MTSTINLVVPDLGDFENVEVIEVLVSAGDSVLQEDGLIVVETDKASMDIPAPQDGVIGSLRASELARGRIEDARTVLKVGEEIEAKFTNVDRKNRSVALSIKAKEVHEEAEAISSYKSDAGSAPAGTTLGELLKEKMSGGGK